MKLLILKRRFLLARLSIILLLVAAFAWIPTASAEGKTLQMLVWTWSPEVDNRLDQTIKAFESSSGTKVAVVRCAFSDYQAKLLLLFAAGSPPDLFWVTPKMLQEIREHVKPLKDLLQDLLYRTTPELLEAFKCDDRMCGLPLGSYDSFGMVAYAIPFQATTEKAELAANLIRFLREVGFAAPFGLFEVGRLPLFSVDDGIVFVQSKANGCLPTFYGQLEPFNGYQLTNVSYSVSTSTEDDYMSSVDFELTFWAIHEGKEVVLTGPASFSWKRVDDLTWQLEASFELISGEGETISMRDELITQISVDEDAYEVDESVYVIYTVDLVPFKFSSESSTTVERIAENKLMVKTTQKATIYSGDNPLYSEANTVTIEKTIHTADHTEFDWTTTSETSEGTYQSGRVHQHLHRYEDLIEVLVDQFDLTVNEETLTLVEPSFIRLKEIAEGKFLLSWELALKSSAGALPLISTNAEFVTWSVEEGKFGLAERLTVTIAEYGYEKTLHYYLDPPGFKEWLVKKTNYTAGAAASGAAAAALTTWWSPGIVVSVPTVAVSAGIGADVGYNVALGYKWVARKIGLQKDKTPPHVGVGLVKEEWQTQIINGKEVQRLVATYHITAVDGESGIKSIKETVGSNPTETHSGNNAPKYTFLFTITDADGAGETSTGQINVVATNGDGVKTLPITCPAIKARGRDTTPPSLSFRQTAKGMEGNCFVARFEITATDSQSGILSITETVGSNPTETHNAPIRGQKTYIYKFHIKDCQSPYSINTSKVTAKATNAVGVSSAVQSWEAYEEGVCLYEHINFGDAMINFTADDLDLTNNILRNTISWNEQASSIIVSDGWIVTIYEKINFKGASREVKGPAQDPDFTKSSWNDKVSSIEVKKTKSLPSLWQELLTLPAGSDIIELKEALFKALRQVQKEKLLDFNEALEAIKEVMELPDTVPEGGLKEDQLPNLKKAVDKVK
jgi:hypothetical protein